MLEPILWTFAGCFIYLLGAILTRNYLIKTLSDFHYSNNEIETVAYLWPLFWVGSLIMYGFSRIFDRDSL